MKQLAQVFGRELRYAVDVLGNRDDVLGDPGRRRTFRWDESTAESAGRARVDERLDACRGRLLQQVQSAADVGIDESLARVTRNMRLVQRGGMQNGVDASHALPDEIT